MKTENLNAMGVYQINTQEMGIQNGGIIITGTAIACTLVGALLVVGIATDIASTGEQPETHDSKYAPYLKMRF